MGFSRNKGAPSGGTASPNSNSAPDPCLPTPYACGDKTAGSPAKEAGGAGGPGGSGNLPADIPPDGTGDDQVARQLREAAMKETDPELRERLWEEYRKYKQSTQ